jgi:CRISPR-associated protein Csh1
MLEPIKLLGKHEIAREGLDDIAIFLDKASLANTRKVIWIVFKKDGDILTYEHTHPEDYEPSKLQGYLYKTTQHKRYDVSPTAKIKKITKGEGKEKTLDGEEVVKSVEKRLFLWLNTFDCKDPLISSLKKAFEDNREEIFDDFLDKYRELRVYKDERGKRIDEQAAAILTIKIQEEGQEKYLGDFEIFKRIFREETERKFYYRKSFGESESKGSGICYVCKSEGEVLGFASPFSFYTMDKRGFAPEFERHASWKRLPICKECAKSLAAGRGFLDSYLKKGFYSGYQFYVIPNFLLGGVDENLIKEIKRGEKKINYEGLLIEDDYFLEPVKERGDALNLIFMFIEPKQGGNFDIVRYVEDVPPSWVKKMGIVLREVNNLQIFREESLRKIGIVGKKLTGDLKNIDARGTRLGGLVSAFFPKSKETGTYAKYFIDTIGDILAQKTINRDLLFGAFIREIRNAYVKTNKDNKKIWNEKVLALKSLMLLLFLYKLNLIKRGETMVNEENKAKNVKNFFEEYNEAFDTASKRAVFLEGILTKFLMDVQYANRKSTPFRTKLYGLKLDALRIKRLFPEILEKLRDYKAGYPWLEEDVAKYFVEADNEGWELSKDEISYYFALGLSLGGLFKEKVDEKGGVGND